MFQSFSNFYLWKEDKAAVFVLRLSVIDVEGLDIELLMYHIFKVRSRLFSVSIAHLRVIDSHFRNLPFLFIRSNSRLYFFQL